MLRPKHLGWLVASCALFAPTTGWGANQPEGTVGQAPASGGSTEIEGQGKFATAAAPDAIEADDALEFNVSAGGLFSTGNARALSVTGATNFRIRRSRHQFLAIFAGNYGRAALDADSDPETTVENVQGRVRYDVFLHPRVSLFAMATARHDEFQGLTARVNVDPGLAVYILKDPKNRLWAEAGYDFQYDRRTTDAISEKDEDGNIVLDADGEVTIIADREVFNHAIRLFGGYSNNINDAVTFSTGVEYLQSVLEAERWRINWDVALAVQLINRLSLSTTLTVRMDNDPAPDVRKVDTVTSVSLIYRFF